MGIKSYIDNAQLIATGPSLRERLGRRNGSTRHNKVVRQLRRFRENLEHDMLPEPWTNLSGPVVLVLADVCDALALSDDERVEVLGRAGEQALSEMLENRTVTTPLNERQSKALTYARRRGSVNLGAFRQLCPGWSDETLRRDLVELAQRGLLVKNGTCKGTRYILTGLGEV